VGEVAEVSALGAARLAWRVLDREAAWSTGRGGRIYRPRMDPDERRRHRRDWSGEISRARFIPSS
jgi:glycerol kinase